MAWHYSLRPRLVCLRSILVIFLHFTGCCYSKGGSEAKERGQADQRAGEAETARG